MKTTTVKSENGVNSVSTTTEHASSIEVSRNAKGDYSWSVKVYFEEEGTDYIAALDLLGKINENLRQKYSLPLEVSK